MVYVNYNHYQSGDTPRSVRVPNLYPKVSPNVPRPNGYKRGRFWGQNGDTWGTPTYMSPGIGSWNRLIEVTIFVKKPQKRGKKFQKRTRVSVLKNCEMGNFWVKKWVAFGYKISNLKFK